MKLLTRKWTIALFILIILDSIFTVYIGGESNTIILWFMNNFKWTLKEAMVVRVFYTIPLIFILSFWDKYAMYVLMCYIGIYIGGVFIQIC